MPIGPGTLNEATTATKSTEGFPNSGRLLIAGNHSMAEPEVVSYTGKTETTFLNCDRGDEASQPAGHAL
jgi:hypothetical protein